MTTKKNVKAIPDGSHTLTPQISTKDAKSAVAFYEKVLGAEILHQMALPDGTVMHAALRLGDSTFFVAEAKDFPPTSSNTYVYVRDVDAAYGRAIAGGAKSVSAVTDMFWGDRWAMVADPYGNVWQLATHVEDVSPEEMDRRMKALPG
jgi:PhnB protein